MESYEFFFIIITANINQRYFNLDLTLEWEFNILHFVFSLYSFCNPFFSFARQKCFLLIFKKQLITITQYSRKQIFLNSNYEHLHIWTYNVEKVVYWNKTKYFFFYICFMYILYLSIYLYVPRYDISRPSTVFFIYYKKYHIIHITV